MKKDIFLRLLFPLLFILISINGCDTKKSKEEVIIGEWKAHWQTKADENMPELNGENLNMNGLIKFMENGQVEISAFGYEGCIFSDDTLRNILNWKIDDAELRFIDAGDVHGLPYTIKKFSMDELHLTLLEDINLTLSRN